MTGDASLAQLPALPAWLLPAWQKLTWALTADRAGQEIGRAHV